MKNNQNQKQSKLALHKFSVAKLQQMQSIQGGDLVAQGTTYWTWKNANQHQEDLKLHNDSVGDSGSDLM